MTVPLEKLITEAALAKLAGKRSFERGVAYFRLALLSCWTLARHPA